VSKSLSVHHLFSAPPTSSKMRISLLTLLSLCALAAAAPAPQASSSAAPDDPSAADPTSPPKTISFPNTRGQKPSAIPTQPSQCDGQNPSDDCFRALGSSSGYLYFDKDSACDANQQGQLQTALWDAITLAGYSNLFPNAGEGARGPQSGRFYMGPDFQQFQGRISGNLKRVFEFMTSPKSSGVYITMSCKDTKNYCGKKIDNKAVGGYAWTYSGWFGYYHYITLCPTFFTLETLDTKLQQVESDLASGSTKTATDMTWLRTTGQFFLHEIMHTRLADGGVEPHIIDEFVAPVDPGSPRFKNDVYAYGPRLVHNLAKRTLNEGGGATRASTNADSYAMLANAIWWWDTTGYFPGVPGRPDPATAQYDFDDGDFPVSLHIDLGNNTNLATVDFVGLYNDDLTAFSNGPPNPNDQASSSVVPTSAVPTSTSSAAAPPPSPTDDCSVQYDLLFDHFDVKGKNFDEGKIGSDGSALKSSISREYQLASTIKLPTNLSNL
jgi:hypothetical protein